MEACGVSFEVIGTVGGENLLVDGLIDLPVEKIKERWEATITDYVR